MKNTILLSLLSVSALFASATAEIHIDANLTEAMKIAGPNGTVSALVYLDNQVNIKTLSDSITEAKLRFHDRHQLVVETLRTTATTS